MEPVKIKKVLGRPETVEAKVLYLVKEDDGGLNAILPDTTGTRPAVMYRKVRLLGPEKLVMSGNTPVFASYTILNYDSFTEYNVSISNGSVSVEGDTISITTPATVEDLYLTVNGELSKIFVVPAGIEKPELLYPYLPGQQVLPSFSVVVTGFDVNEGTDTASHVDIQVSEDPEFMVGVLSFTQPLSPVEPSVSGLTPGKLYYLRARHVGNTLGNGPWSTASSVFVSADTDNFQENTTVFSNHGIPAELHGWSLDLSGDGSLLVVGSPGAHDGQGYVTLYRRESGFWVYATRLTATDGNRGDQFGYSVALSKDGQVLAIGAPGVEQDLGSVYFYRLVNEEWEFRNKQTPTLGIGKPGDRHGHSLAISADGGLVAASSLFGNNSQSLSSGYVFIYELTAGPSWTFRQKLSVDTGNTDDQFGQAVAMSADGSVIAVSAPKNKQAGVYYGAVYTYRLALGIWEDDQRLQLPVFYDNYRFGQALKLSEDGTRLLTTSIGNGNKEGLCHSWVETAGTWNIHQSFSSSDSVLSDNFGLSLAINHDASEVLVGETTYGSNQGAVYHFRLVNGNYTEIDRLVESSPYPGNRFGFSAALSSNGLCLAISSPQSENGSSSVYIFN